jgi:hypothetical protein
MRGLLTIFDRARDGRLRVQALCCHWGKKFCNAGGHHEPQALFVAVPATLFILGNGAANAGQTIDRVGAIACITDKWDEKEPEKGHKLVDSVQRCVLIQNDAAAEKVTQDCVGKYEYVPDGSRKGSGTCTDNYKGGKVYESWEEGSHASGGGTYFYESLTDTLAGGPIKASWCCPRLALTY